MSDLTDRQEAIKVLYEEFKKSPIQILPPAQPERRNCESCRYNAYEWDEEPCDSCTGAGSHWKPSADPERRRGKWIPHNTHFTFSTGETSDGGVKCSLCGFETHNKLHTIIGCPYKYCPNCGADMRTAAQIVHDAIDNTPMAEDAYPGIKERLHKAVDDMREGTT